MDEEISVLVVDDHELFRSGIRTALADTPGIDVVGEAADGQGAVDLVSTLAPDVVLLDIHMPVMSGIEACAQIKVMRPATKVLVITASSAESDLLAAMRAGANGYVLKDVPMSQIPQAVRAVRAGQVLISPTMSATMLAQFATLTQTGGDRPRGLTPREEEVLVLLAQGRSNKDIAATLFLSENTVKNHVKSILEKLGARSRMEAVVRASRAGIVSV